MVKNYKTMLFIILGVVLVSLVVASCGKPPVTFPATAPPAPKPSCNDNEGTGQAGGAYCKRYATNPENCGGSNARLYCETAGAACTPPWSEQQIAECARAYGHAASMASNDVAFPEAPNTYAGSYPDRANYCNYVAQVGDLGTGCWIEGPVASVTNAIVSDDGVAVEKVASSGGSGRIAIGTPINIGGECFTDAGQYCSE